MEKNNEMPSDRWVEDHLAKLDPSGEAQPNAAQALGRFKELRDEPKPGTRKWIWTAAAGIVTACGALWFWAPQPHSPGAPAKQPTTVSASMITLKEGQTPPDFTLPDSTGAPVHLASYRGKVVLLNFWATWCIPCREEISWFMEFTSKYQDRGLEIIGVAMDGDGWESARPYVRVKKINYPVVVGTDAMAAQYGVEAIPMTLMLDREGKVTATHIGRVDKANAEKEIVKMLQKF